MPIRIFNVSKGATPLYIASQNSHTDVVSLILKFSANPNSQMDDGSSPLYIASQNGHTEIISLLLKANANLDSQGNDGSTL